MVLCKKTSLYTDDYGQKNYASSDFVHVANEFEYLDMACYECIKKANAYYDGTDASFDKIPEQAESWTIPVYSDNEFIIKEHLNSKNIKPYYKNQHSNFE